MSFSSKEIAEVRPELERVTEKILGSVDDRVLAIFERGLYNGYEKEKLINKLSTLVDEKKAYKLADKIETIMDYYRDSKPKKRQIDDDEMKESKKIKTNHEETAKPADGPLTSVQIKKMMEMAQRQIEERKKKLEAIKISSGSNDLVIDMASDERQRKIAELKMQIQAKISGNLGLNQAGSALIPKPSDKPRPLILDDEGRTVDMSGREINIQTLTPTLKANIRAKKKETFKTQQVEKATEEAKTAESAFFDERLMAKSSVRGKRALRFHEPGKFQMMAERMRMKAQYEKLQNEISQIARKTGISSATKLALIAPKTDVHNEEIPKYEWWDSVILTEDLNKVIDGKISIREQAITNLIEHPIQAFPPNESIRPVFLPVFLTKKEQKKLRRQNRREAWKEEQEKIRLGLIEPPEPKLKISNLMRVLGNEAIQDPTKIEAHVREQMAKRQQDHKEANQAKKLTEEQRREKKIKKLKEDTSMGVNVSVYRIRDLHNVQSKKFKVETNAKQLYLTGVVALFRDCCVVVVEGGPKQQKRYKRLMMHRIKWEEDLVKCNDATTDGEKEIPNSCNLVWEGKVPKRNFGEVKLKAFLMEKMAREFFQKHHCEHYWDLAYSGAVLEASDL